MRAAKAKAATAGESLKALVERAVAREVAAPAASRHHVEYPLIRSRRTGPDLSNEDIADLLAEDDAQQYAS